MAVTYVLTGTTQSVTATNGSNAITVASTTGWVVGATVDGTGWAAGTKIVSFVANTSAVLSNNFTGTTGATNVIVSSNTGTVTVTLAASGDTSSPLSIISAGYGVLIGNRTIQIYGNTKIILQIATGAAYDDTEWVYELGSGSSLRFNESYGCGTWRSGYILNGSTYVKAKGHTINYNNFDSNVGGRGICFQSGAPPGFVAGSVQPTLQWNDVAWYEAGGSNAAANLATAYSTFSAGRIVMDYANDGAGANAGFQGSYGTIESLLLYKCIGGFGTGSIDTTKTTTIGKFEYFSLPSTGTEVRMAFPNNVVVSGFAPITYQIPATNTNMCCNTTASEILLDVVYPIGLNYRTNNKAYSNNNREYRRTVTFMFKDSTGTALTNTTLYIKGANNDLINAVQAGDFSQGVQHCKMYWTGPAGSYRYPSTFIDNAAQTAQIRKNGYVQQTTSYNIADSAYSQPFFMLADPGYGSVTPTAAAALTGITPNYGNQIVEVSSSHNLDEVYAYGGYSLALPANSQYSVYQTSSGGTYSLTSPWSMQVIAGNLTMGTYNTKINGSKQFLVKGNTVAHCTSVALWGTASNTWNAGEIWGTYVTYNAATSVTLNKADTIWTPSGRADMWQIAGGATLNMTNGATLTFSPTATLGYGAATTSEFRSGSTVNISDSTVTYNIVSGGSGTVFSNTEAGSTWNISNSTLTLNCPNGAQVAIHAYFLPASTISNFTVNGTATNVVWQMGYTSNNSKMTGFTYGGAIFGNGTSNVLMDKYTYSGALTTIPNTFGASNKWWWVDPKMNAGGLFRWAAGSTPTGVSGFYGVIGFRPTITMDKTGYAPRARFTASAMTTRYPSFQATTTAFTAIPLSNFFRDPTFMSGSDGFLPFLDSLDDKTVLNTIDWVADFRQSGWVDQSVTYTAATAKFGTIVSTISGAVDVNYVNASTGAADAALITVNTGTKTISSVSGTLTWSPQRLYNALKNWWATYASNTDFLSATGSGILDLGNYNVDSSIIFGATATGDALTQVRTTGTINNAQNAVPITANVAQTTPTNLSGVTINGSLTFNTNTNITITITNSTITGTISNSGTGIVTITNSGSTLGTIGANVTVRLVGIYTLTGLQAGSSVYIADNTSAQIDYVASSGTSYSYDATGGTGTWVAKVRKYGQQDQNYTFTPASGASTQVASYTADTFVVASLATAQAYTDLNTFQKVYDYSRYFGTTVAAMPFNQLFNKGFGTLTANYPYTLDPAAAAIMDITGGVITTHTTGFAESGTLIVSGDFTQGTATLTNDVQIRATNLDSEIIFTGIDAITIYASQSDAFTNTNPGAYSNTGIVRYLYGAVLSGVTMSGTVYLRTEIGTVVEIQALTLTQGTTTLSLSTVVLLQKALLDLTEIKGKTNSLTFTVAGVVDSNIQYVNDVEVKGVGSDNDPWNPV